MTDNNKKSLHVKTGDRVIITAGKDKGKTGNVKKAIPSEGQVIVEGANMQTKHQKQTRTERAEIKHIEGPIDASNVMFYDTKAKKAIKIGYKIDGDQKLRVNRKTGEVID